MPGPQSVAMILRPALDALRAPVCTGTHSWQMCADEGHLISRNMVRLQPYGDDVPGGTSYLGYQVPALCRLHCSATVPQAWGLHWVLLGCCPGF